MAAAFRDRGSRDPAKGKDGALLPRPAGPSIGRLFRATEASINREGDDVVPALKVDLGVTARADHDVLLAVHRVGRRRCIAVSYTHLTLPTILRV